LNCIDICPELKVKIESIKKTEMPLKIGILEEMRCPKTYIVNKTTPKPLIHEDDLKTIA